jgi:hypothetical protein
VKDGPEGEKFFSKFVQVDLGRDQYDLPITSLLIVPLDAAEAAAAAKPAPSRRLTARQKNVLAQLANCIANRGKPVPPHFGLPNGMSAVTIKEWQDACLSTGAIDTDAKNPRADFTQTKEALIAKQLIGEQDKLAWLAAP